MNSRTFTLLAVSCTFGIILLFSFGYYKSGTFQNEKPSFSELYKTSIYNSDWSRPVIIDESKEIKDEKVEQDEVNSWCTIESCLDLSRCNDKFKVSIDYSNDAYQSKASEVHLLLIQAIKKSKYYTNDIDEACVIIPSIDTTDRDTLSKNYVHSLQTKLQSSPLWNNGINYLIFNIYSGTFPNYEETYLFKPGNAMLAKASFSTQSYRNGFDISFPLFQNNHPFDIKIQNQTLNTKYYSSGHQYMIGFKGKRYVYGIGSEVRSKLFIVNNGMDIVLLTTCKHGKQWQKMADERCKEDNEEYDRFSYNDLLQNSSFCLVPRGRRLGSFRFLESLKFGCIPVVMSDGWVLPFHEVIDWSKCALVINEHELLQVPSILQSIPEIKIASMRQQALFIYNTYFSSITKIIDVTLEIIVERVNPLLKKSYVMWNYPPGALSIDPVFSKELKDYPFYYPLIGVTPSQKFTAMIYAVSSVPFRLSPLFQLIRIIAKSKFVDQILVIWLSSSRIPRKNLWPKSNVLISVLYANRKTSNSRFYHSSLVKTDAIFAFDENAATELEEMDFAFSVWRSFPDRLVGPSARTHLWDYEKQNWHYSSKVSNSYSMVLSSAIVYHKYYNYLYSNHLPPKITEMVDLVQDCEIMAMNFLVTSITNSAPIVTTSPKHRRSDYNPNRVNHPNLINHHQIEPTEHFMNHQKCFQDFIKAFGILPEMSMVKFNPSLYRDPVSSFRKRFKFLEN